MPKPICVKCGTFCKPKRNGVYVCEYMPRHSNAPPGIANAKGWMPYKVWVADMNSCHTCGYEVVHGFGGSPMSERHHDDFDKWMALVTVHVYDC